MHYQQLKKRLLLESGILSGTLAAAGAVVFFLSLFSDDYEKSASELESKVNAIAASTNALSNKYDKVRQNEALFKKVVQLQSEDGFTITPQVAQNRFNYLRDAYYLNNLHLIMSPITEMSDANYRRPTN